MLHLCAPRDGGWNLQNPKPSIQSRDVSRRGLRQRSGGCHEPHALPRRPRARARGLLLVPRVAEPSVNVSIGAAKSLHQELDDQDIVARALQREGMLEELTLTLNRAVLMEDYKLAAKTRDEVNQLRREDPVETLQTALEQAIAEERYEDAGVVMAEGTLNLVGTWVGRANSGNDPYGRVLAIEKGLKLGRLVGSILSSVYREQCVVGDANAQAVAEIFPSAPGAGRERVVRYLETSAEGEVSRYPAKLDILSKDEFVLTRQPHPRHSVQDAGVGASVSAAAAPRMLCKCCHNIILPLQHDTLWDVRDISGFNVEYLADEPSITPRATRLRVPGSVGVTMETMAVPQAFGVTAGEKSPSLWFTEHTRQPLVCARCSNTVGFRYRQAGEDKGSNVMIGDEFDGLFAQALVPEEGETIACCRLPEALHFQRLCVLQAGVSEPWSLQGLYVGSYGGHGPELVMVSVDDDGHIISTKQTGDPNVPAGEVTFRAKAEGKLSGGQNFPPEWCVLAAYPGKGRVAQAGFTDPQWVDGLLLSIDTRKAQAKLGRLRNQQAAGKVEKRDLYLTESFANANIGFVWNVEGQRSMVLFTRQKVQNLNELHS